ncbi:MAG: DUF4163 domain-containing protein [Abditibacteriota bacterium]|nr:DUF4163 domain-containing protein [Abditibacteriota bacterium]
MKRLFVILLVLSAVSVLRGADYETLSYYDHKDGKYYINFKYPVITSGEEYAKASNRDHYADQEKCLKDFREITDDILKEVDLGYELELDNTLDVTLNREDAFSTRDQVYFNTGGAHPNTVTLCRTYIKGLPGCVTARDLFTDVNKAAALMKPMLDAERRERISDPEADEATLTVDINNVKDSIDCFVISEIGVNWIFDPYVLGSYAEGRYEALLTWADLKDILKPQPVIDALCREFDKKLYLTGEVVLPMDEMPKGSSLQAALKSGDRVLETRPIDEDWGREIPFALLFDKPAGDRKDCSISVELLFDGQRGYAVSLPAESAEGVRAVLESVERYEAGIKEGDTAEVPYMLYSCKAVYVEKTRLGRGAYLEVRLLDGDKILAKRFTREYLFNPAELSVCFDVSRLEADREYYLKVLLRDGDKVLFESEKQPFTRGSWTKMPQNIRLVKK